MSRIGKLVKNPFLAYDLAAGMGLTRWVGDEVHLRLMYRANMGCWPDLESPKTFNEKLQWLKLHDRNPLYTTLVDKYRVKQWVSDRIGEQYVTKTYDVWDSVDEIDLSGLPDRFVLKTNHDCGGIAICGDRAAFDFGAAKKKLDAHLHTNYFWRTREWPYKNVKPCIFAEEYLEPNPVKNDLVDYKIMCFGGKARCAFTCEGRGEGDLRVDFFDLDWNRLPFTRHYPNSDSPVPRPAGLERMIELSERLSQDIPFVRVDFYEVGSDLYFGEMTFYPGSGMEEFNPEQWDEELGTWVELPLGGGGCS